MNIKTWADRTPSMSECLTIEATMQAEIDALRAELAALKAQPVQPAPLTDAQASKIARLIANRNAELCNVDPEDNWKIYGQDFIDEVRFFEAAVRTGGAG